MNNWFKDFVTVKATPNFSIMLNPKRDPLEKEGYSYHLVFNRYSTIEASANSFLLISTFLDEAENGLASLEAPEEQVDANKLN